MTRDDAVRGVRSGSVWYHEALTPLLRPIDSVHTAEWNYNNGDVEEIVTSIIISGMYRPIYAQKSTGAIVAGNHTWAACKEMGADQIPVVELDIDDMTARRLLVADNEIARKARPDHGLLLTILETLNEQDTLLGSGVNEQELIQLRELVKMEPEYAEADDYASWPLFCVQLPPHVKAAFLDMTSVAGDDREKFELLMRLGGWAG